MNLASSFFNIVSKSLGSNTAKVLTIATSESVLVFGVNKFLLFPAMINQGFNVAKLGVGTGSLARLILVSKALSQWQQIQT